MTGNELQTLGDVWNTVGTWLASLDAGLRAHIAASKAWFWNIELADVWQVAASLLVALVLLAVMAIANMGGQSDGR
jgi:hypothetical protein